MVLLIGGEEASVVEKGSVVIEGEKASVVIGGGEASSCCLVYSLYCFSLCLSPLMLCSSFWYS